MGTELDKLVIGNCFQIKRSGSKFNKDYKNQFSQINLGNNYFLNFFNI